MFVAPIPCVISGSLGAAQSCMPALFWSIMRGGGLSWRTRVEIEEVRLGNLNDLVGGEPTVEVAYYTEKVKR